MMAVFDLLQHGLELAADSLVHPPAEDLRDFVGTQTEQTQLAGALEDLVDREAASEDEVAAILHLVDRVAAAEVHRLAVFSRELWAQHQSPVVESFLNPCGAETVGGGLQSCGVGCR